MASASIAVIRFEALKEITKRGLFLFQKVVDLASTQIFLDGLSLHFNTISLKKQAKVDGLTCHSFLTILDVTIDKEVLQAVLAIDTKFRLDSKHFVGKQDSIKWNKKLKQDFYADRS